MKALSKLRLATIFAAPLVIAGVLWVVQPEKCAWLPPCPFHWLTGLHCPGCGTTRALHKLVHGDIAAGFRLNSLTMLLLPVLLYTLVSDVYCEVTGRQVRSILVSARASVVIAVLIIAFGILRNIPVYPLNLLAPH